MPQNTKQEAPLLPVYLIVGEDALKRDTVMKRLRVRLAKLGDLSFNSDEFNGETALGGDIVAACNTVPFASPVRLVEVRGADKLKKADAEALVTYLEAPNETTVLALVAEKLAKNTRLYKAVAKLGKTAVIDCAPLKRYELPKTVRALAVGHGVTLTEGAANVLVDLVGEDTVHLDNELKKIALAHRGSDAVNEHEIMGLVSRTAEVKPWEFVDAFAARDTRKCLLYLGRMDSVSPHALLAMCTTRLRELVCARSLAERGNPRGVAAALKLPDWRCKNHATWARGFTAAELRQALISSRDTERAMKSGTDPNAAFLDWVLLVTTRS
ncbi:MULTISPECIES: DNA polymerase III subunit delta [Gordonibacter]|uniref:DNA polymerase III subunit delta n=1 Tax=Gordonibacter faecis TaxID=3047475 RepID=A0ABT7DIS7_9ACTN|nr:MULTISPECIES: DNA polymerase III subunit delta [unclassified Gordonibacter]MDJ1649282.1 DNA polymerase III subunit delta [Gordonibacter sp. KGMB12511]HIW75251.1 DNA polymerase III subunit delta [Candidatus Gordonibacter avicola]